MDGAAAAVAAATTAGAPGAAGAGPEYRNYIMDAVAGTLDWINGLVLAGSGSSGSGPRPYAVDALGRMVRDEAGAAAAEQQQEQLLAAANSLRGLIGQLQEVRCDASDAVVEGRGAGRGRWKGGGEGVRACVPACEGRTGAAEGGGRWAAVRGVFGVVLRRGWGRGWEPAWQGGGAEGQASRCSSHSRPRPTAPPLLCPPTTDLPTAGAIWCTGPALDLLPPLPLPLPRPIPCP